MDCIEKAKKEIDEYENYEENWDGYGGNTFHPEVLIEARESLERIDSFFQGANIVPDELFTGPCGDGRIDIEIKYNGKELIITHDYSEKLGMAFFETERRGAEVSEFTVGEFFTSLSWLIE